MVAPPSPTLVVVHPLEQQLRRLSLQGSPPTLAAVISPTTEIPLVMGLQTRERQMPAMHAIMTAMGTTTWRVAPPRSTTSPHKLRTKCCTRMWRGLGSRHLKMKSALHVSQPAAGAANRRRASLGAALPAATVVFPTSAAAADGAAVVVDGGDARASRAAVELVLGAAAVVRNGVAAPRTKPATVPQRVRSWCPWTSGCWSSPSGQLRSR